MFSRVARDDEYYVMEVSGNPIVYFTREYTEQVLHANWCPGTNHDVPSQFAEAIKKEGGSWSWDLRLEYNERWQSRPRSSRPSTATNRAGSMRDARDDEFYVMEVSGNPIVYFTKEYTEHVLNGNWCPGTNPDVPPRFAEATKKEGGSWSWDLRLQYSQRQGGAHHASAQRTPSRPSTATKRLPDPSAVDVFLSHKWGKDANGRDNHARVARIRDELEKRGIRCWFDEVFMAGNVNAAMAQGIENSKCFVAFITDHYRDDINSGVDNNCRSEFNHGKLMKGSHKMVAVVLEEGMRNPREWRGELGFALGSNLYVDLASDDPHHWQQGINKLYESIQPLLK